MKRNTGKILTLYVQAFKEKLFVAFMMFVLEALDMFTVIGEKFPLFVENFRAAYDHMNKVYLKYDHKYFTEKIHKANQKRSKAFSRFNNYVRSFTLNIEDEAKTAAAGRILKVIGMYGASNILGQGMREISVSMVNLIEDCEDICGADLETIGADRLLAALRQAQEGFDEIYMTRTEHESETGRHAMVEARKRMTAAYRSLVTTVNENVQFDTEGVLAEFVRFMNVEIRKSFIHTGQAESSKAETGEDGEDGASVG